MSQCPFLSSLRGKAGHELPAPHALPKSHSISELPLLTGDSSDPLTVALLAPYLNQSTGATPDPYLPASLSCPDLCSASWGIVEEGTQAEAYTSSSVTGISDAELSSESVNHGVDSCANVSHILELGPPGGSQQPVRQLRLTPSISNHAAAKQLLQQQHPKTPYASSGVTASKHTDPAALSQLPAAEPSLVLPAQIERQSAQHACQGHQPPKPWELKRPVLEHCPKLTRRQLRSLNCSFSLDEVAQHKYKDDAWIAVDGKVYDITEHLVNHPGWESAGISTVLSILAHIGTDCSEEFHVVHRPYPVAYKQLKAFYIGELLR